MNNIFVKNRTNLKIGDVVSFYNHGVGGFLFGIIVASDSNTEKIYNPDSKIEIWRPKSNYEMGSIINVVHISMINDVAFYRRDDLLELIEAADNQGIPYTFIMKKEELEK